jgi:hypothetical protein
LTIGIDSEERLFERDFELDIVIHEKDIEFILRKIKEYEGERGVRNVEQLDIHTRFMRCMKNLEYYSISQNGNKSEDY